MVSRDRLVELWLARGRQIVKEQPSQTRIETLLRGQSFDSVAFAHTLTELGQNVPELAPALVARDVQLVEAGGLYAFVKLAWHIVEPSSEYVDNWHIPVVCARLEAVTDGKIRKLIINIPPGCMKSLLVSSLWPAWEWTFAPGTVSLYGSYAQKIANKNAKLHLDLVLSDWYQARWGSRVTLDKRSAKAVSAFENDAKGARHTVSVGSATTGLHAHRLNFDDLVNAKDARGRALIDPIKIEGANDWWFNDAVSRRKDPNTTTYVGIMQRMHHNDTASLCIKKGYGVLAIPMEYDPDFEHKCPEDPRTERGELLWPERYDREEVEQLKVDLGSMIYSAQYQQQPTLLKGAIFQADWFDRRWDPETLDVWLKIITVDCTFKDAQSSDYVVIQCWGIDRSGKYCLLDQLRGKWDVIVTKREVLRMWEWHPDASVYVEDKANGPAIVQSLEADGHTGVCEWSPGRSGKVERAYAVTPLYEAGNVLFPPDALAPWLEEHRREHTRFPVAKYDDQVDGGTMALLILRDKNKPSVLDAFS